MTNDRKLVWTADELSAAGFRYEHPLDDGAAVTPTPLSRITRLERTGVNLARVPPGRGAFPVHRHHAEEEWVYVVSGTADVQLDGETHRLGAGSFVAFPPGGPAHALENPSAEEELVCLTGGENADVEIIDFLKSGRRLVRGRALLDTAPADRFEPFDFFAKSPEGAP